MIMVIMKMKFDVVRESCDCMRGNCSFWVRVYFPVLILSVSRIDLHQLKSMRLHYHAFQKNHEIEVIDFVMKR